MLDALVAVIAGLLVVAGIVVIVGPQRLSGWWRLRRGQPTRRPRGSQPSRQRDAVPPGLNPKTQRVLLAATRLSTWLHAHGQEEIAREVRNASARLATDEPSGLYAMQTALRRLRALTLDDRHADERLRLLSSDLRKSVQDRFEQLELLPFGRL